MSIKRASRLTSGRLGAKTKKARITKVSGVIRASNGRVWIQERKSSGGWMPPVALPLAKDAGTVLIQVGLPVELSHDRTGQRVIRGMDTVMMSAQGISPAYLNRGDPQSVTVITDQIQTLRCRPSQTADEEMFAEVLPGVTYDGTRYNPFIGTPRIDLSGDVPAAGQHLYTVVGYTKDGTLESGVSTTQADTIALDDSDIQEAIDNLSPGSLPEKAFKLVGGQTVLLGDTSNSKDLRPPFSPSEIYRAKVKLGFVNRTDSTLAYDSVTRTVTLAPTVGGVPFEYYTLGGILQRTTDTFTLTHVDATAGYFFYFDEDNIFTASTTAWDLLTDAPVCFVSYSGILSEGVAFEERHGAERNPIAHLELHEQIGTYKVEGFGASGFTVDSATPVDADNTFALAAGILADEDIRESLATLPDDGPYKVFYRSGASGEWVWSEEVLPFIVTGTRIDYNEFTGSTWQLTEAPTQKWMNIWVVKLIALEDEFQTALIVDQSLHDNLSDAVAESFSGLEFGTLPFQEFVATHQVTYEIKNAFNSATGRVRIESLVELEQSREQVVTSPSSNHNSLGGLQGGLAGERYHLTLDEHTELQGWLGGTAKFTITGDDNQIQQRITGWPTQTVPIWQVEAFGGAPLSGADERGILFSDGGADPTNLYLGNNTGNINATGVGNFFAGTAVAPSATTASYNVGLGDDVFTALTEGDSNFGMGQFSLNKLTTASSTVAIGSNSLASVVTANRNTGVGGTVGKNVTGNNNSLFGFSAGRDMDDGDFNLVAGSSAGQLATNDPSRCVLLGYQTGQNVDGDGVVYIGYNAGKTMSGSNKLNIHNSDTATPLIYGEFDGAGGVGLKTYTPDPAAVGFTIVGASLQTANKFEAQSIASLVNVGIRAADNINPMLFVTDIETLSAGVSDGYTGGLDLHPQYDAAFTVARHNYINLPDATLTNSAAITDAAVLRFDAAAGTHKAVDGPTTKITPGGVDAWRKDNVNGTIHYSPMYLSKTA